MSEVRQDPIAGHWVIIAPERAQRPHALRPYQSFPDVAVDPFAEGQEHQTPGELQAIRTPGTSPDAPGWSVRVVPNKYPAARWQADRRSEVGSFAVHEGMTPAPACGPHEVIIESPRLDLCLSELSREQVRSVVGMYRERLRFHRDQQTCAHAMVFKNKGVEAGATIAHIHSQLLGSQFAPPLIAQELERSEAHFQSHGRNLFAEFLTAEEAASVRIVVQTRRFSVLTAYAARVPGETWIVPRFQQAAFEECNDVHLAEFSDLLRATLQGLVRLSPHLPYNYALHSTPFSLSHVPWYRWHLEILPRSGTQGGFEWGGGAYINSLPPEEAARQLRSVITLPPDLATVSTGA